MNNDESQKGSDSIRPYLSPLENGQKPKPDNPDNNLSTASSNDKKDPLSSGELEQRESDSTSTAGEATTTGGSFWNSQSGQTSNDANSKQGSGRRFLRTRNQKLAVGGGIGAITVGGILFGFLALIPLKVEDIVSNVESKFMSSTNSAVGNETDNLFSEYIEQHVLPGYRTCGSIVTSGCTATRFFGSDPVTNLYKSWSQGRLEDTLAKADISFEYNTGNKTWTMKGPGLATDGVPIGVDGQSGSVLTKDMGGARSAAYTSLDSALQDETKWKSVYTRYKLGRLLEEKYGIKRCLFVCGLTDPISNNVNAAKNAAALEVTERVILPRNKVLGTALQYILSDGDSASGPPTADPEAVGENGILETPIQIQISGDVRSFAASAGITTDADLQSVQDAVDSINEKGMSNYLLTDALSTVLPEAVAGQAADAIPVIGYLNLAATIVNDAGGASQKLKEVRYAVDVTAAAAMYSTYSTMSDEIHTGGDNANVVGSFVNALGPSSTNVDNTEVGGTSSAEGTPLYASISGDQSNEMPTTSTSGSLISSLSGTADAATTTPASPTVAPPHQYLCNSGQPVPKDKLICPEESVDGGNSYANIISSTLDFSGLTEAAQIWKGTVGQAFGIISDIIGPAFQAAAADFDLQCKLPGSSTFDPYCTAKAFAGQIAPEVENAAVNSLIPDPFSSNMSGGRSFDMIALGADAEGSDSGHDIIGGQQLTPTQTAEITNQQETQAQQQFRSQPLFARLFSTDTQYSLISRLAMDVPLEGRGPMIEGLFTSLLTNPFSKITASMNTLFNAKTSADTTAAPDPFGVIQYGYPDSSSIPDNPETYWQQNCSDNSAQAYQSNATVASPNNWLTDTTTDPSTGQLVNTTNNPCMLIKAAIGASGGLYSTSNLTTDDLNDVGGGQ